MTAAKVLAALGPNARDAKEAWARVDQLVAAGPAGEVVTLAEELCVRKEPAWLVRSVSGRLLRQLAFSSAPGQSTCCSSSRREASTSGPRCSRSSIASRSGSTRRAS